MSNEFQISNAPHPRPLPRLGRGVARGFELWHLKLYFRPLFDTAEHLFQSSSVESHHHLVTCRDYWHTSCTRHFNHLIQCCPIFCHIVFSKFVPFLRKKLFHHLAIGSGRCGINLNLFCCHDRSSFELGCYSFITWPTNGLFFTWAGSYALLLQSDVLWSTSWEGMCSLILYAQQSFRPT